MSAEPDAVPFDYWETGDAGDVDVEGEGDELVQQYAQRATIDFDGKHNGSANEFRLNAYRIWHNLRDLADRVDVHVSTGQHGLHFVAWFEDDLAFHDEITVRRDNGDDPRRLDLDEQRWQQLGGHFVDVLFHEKRDAPRRKERRFRDVYDAVDYILAQRDDYRRLKKVANHGHKGDPELARRADL